MKPSVKIERLTQLIRVLEEVKADKKPFNMWVWFRDLTNTDAPIDNVVGNKRHSCGTASCAAGWAAQDPWFKKRGFTLVPYTEEEAVFSCLGEKKVYMRGDGTEFDACGTFFDETNLFNPGSYCDHKGDWIEKITPNMVIVRTKKLIKSLEAGVDAS